MARVLIVDDEPAISLVLTETLKYAGHSVFSAGGGRQAIELLSGGLRPDVVLLDLFMPHVGGREVLDFMRSTPGLEYVPVILITGAVRNSSEFPPDGSYQGLLPKPFDLEDVIEAVRAHAPRRTGPPPRAERLAAGKG